MSKVAFELACCKDPMSISPGDGRKFLGGGGFLCGTRIDAMLLWEPRSTSGIYLQRAQRDRADMVGDIFTPQVVVITFD